MTDSDLIKVPRCSGCKKDMQHFDPVAPFDIKTIDWDGEGLWTGRFICWDCRGETTVFVRREEGKETLYKAVEAKIVEEDLYVRHDV